MKILRNHRERETFFFSFFSSKSSQRLFEGRKIRSVYLFRVTKI